MKKTLECIGTLIECLLFLWLVIGLWACVHKIKELEDWQKEYIATNSHVETSDNKLHLVVMRCQKMEQDNDMLRLRIEELEDAISDITNGMPNAKPDPASWVPSLDPSLIPLTRENEIFIQSFNVTPDDLIDQNDHVE